MRAHADAAMQTWEDTLGSRCVAWDEEDETARVGAAAAVKYFLQQTVRGLSCT